MQKEQKAQVSDTTMYHNEAKADYKNLFYIDISTSKGSYIVATLRSSAKQY